MSLESRHGWQDLYLSLGAWPERIMAAVRSGTRERDEIDFYLCFFVQCHSLRDWVVGSGLLNKDDIHDAVDSYPCMRLCADIANRYKHLTITRPKDDPNWELWINHDRPDAAVSVTANGKVWLLWELMIECIGFWEAASAAYHLDARSKIFRPS